MCVCLYVWICLCSCDDGEIINSFVAVCLLDRQTDR